MPASYTDPPVFIATHTATKGAELHIEAGVNSIPPHQYYRSPYVPQTTPLNAADLPLHVRASDIRDRIMPVGKSTIFRWVEAGILPKPARIGGVAYWRTPDVIEALRKAGK